MSNELAVKQATGGIAIRDMNDLARLADMLARSGYFQDARDAAQTGVKVLAGLEMGFGAFASMSGIHLISGRPAVGANLMAAAVKSSRKYDYRVRHLDDKRCDIEFFEGGASIGISSFTIEDARKAGTKNLDKFPRNMLFARAMSNGTRWYCPDLYQGATVYTPEELGAEVDAEGNIIDVPVSRVETPAKAPAVEAPAPKPSSEAQVAPEASEPVSEPMATPKQRAAIGKGIEANGLTKDQATAFFSWLFGRAVAGSADFTKAEASRVIGWDEDAWQAALADYAVALEGGVPDEEPTWEGLGPA